MNKCEELKIVHAWKNIENNIVYLTNPPQYPAPERECMNCGKREKYQTKQMEIKEWVEVK